jgi:hypothetical protein
MNLNVANVGMIAAQELFLADCKAKQGKSHEDAQTGLCIGFHLSEKNSRILLLVLGFNYNFIVHRYSTTFLTHELAIISEA